MCSSCSLGAEHAFGASSVLPARTPQNIASYAYCDTCATLHLRCACGGTFPFDDHGFNTHYAEHCIFMVLRAEETSHPLTLEWKAKAPGVVWFVSPLLLFALPPFAIRPSDDTAV